MKPSSLSGIIFLFFATAVSVSLNRLSAEVDSAKGASVQAPSGFAIQLDTVITGLSSPVYLTNAHDGTNRLFIVEQAGRIRVKQPASPSTTVFLDIISKVLSGGERGLLGLAFHPQFSTNRRFFVNYTRRPDGATVIAEYRVSATNPNVADPNESVILTIPQPFANHNGGMIEFGPDGYLYIGMGDGGSANDPGNRAQNISELLGKMLRIDVDTPSGSLPYSSPPSNPFFGSIPGRDEIYATGLRNPWRFSFDRATGQLYAADVGQDAWEEIDLITRGGNYGWRVFEGNHCTNVDPALCNAGGFTPAIAEYAHTSGRCSITGGYVYRGVYGSLPEGAYVFGDFCTGEIFLLQNSVQSLLVDTTLGITSFGEDESGEIYVVGQSGAVLRLASTGGNTQANLSLAASGAAATVTSGLGSAVQAGYATVNVNFGSAPYGTAVFILRQNEVVVSEVGVPTSPPTTAARIFIDYRTNVPAKTDQPNAGTVNINTGFAAVNRGTGPANVDFVLRDSAGTVLTTGNGVLNVNQHRALFINELAQLAPNFVLPANFPTTIQFGTLEILSNQPLSMVALRATTNQRGESLLTTTPIADLTQSLPSGPLYFPQLADGGGFQFTLILLNTATIPSTGTVRIFGNDGAPLAVRRVGDAAPTSQFGYIIPTGGVFRLVTDGSSNPLKVGWAQVTPDPGTATPVGAGLFSYSQGGVLTTESGVPSAVPTTHARIYIDKSGGHDTGLAIANVGAGAQQVTVAAFRNDGATSVGSNATLNLNGDGHEAKFAGELIAELSAGFTGVLDISSPTPFVALTLRLLNNPRGEFLLTTFPVADLNQPAPSPVIFPQIADGGGFRTQVILLGAGASTTATVRYFRSDGVPMAAGKVALKQEE